MGAYIGAVAQMDRASASWTIGHRGGNSMSECGQIRWNLKSDPFAGHPTAIPSQAWLNAIASIVNVVIRKV